MSLIVRNLSDQLVNLVRDRILSGMVPPNSAIRQDALASELGISKIPLREALARLEQEGLVQGRPGAGTFVLKRPDGPPPGVHARLAASLNRWVQSARQEGLDEAAKTLGAWLDAASDVAESRPAEAIVEALADDLNTPKAIAELHALRGRSGHKSLAGSLAFLGLADGGFAAWRDRNAPVLAVPPGQVERLIAARAAARKAKDFAEADRIRGELDSMNIALKDAKDPATGELVTTWEVKR